MAIKMSKAETVSAARGMAARNEEIKAVTVEQLAGLTWDQRRALATAIMTRTSVGRIDALKASYINEASNEFVNAAMNVMALEGKRTGQRAEGVEARDDRPQPSNRQRPRWPESWKP